MELIWVFDGDSSTNVVCEGYAKAFQYLCDLSGAYTFWSDSNDIVIYTYYEDTVSMYGEALLTLSPADYAYLSVTVTGAQSAVTYGEEYTSQPFQLTVNKAEHAAVTDQISVKRGNKMEYDLAPFLPEGYKLGPPSAPMNPDGILPNGVTRTGTVVTGTLANDSKNVGNYAIILVSVVETKNYKHFDIELTVYMTDKTPQNLAFQAGALDKTYEDGAFVNPLTGAAEGSAVTYTSSDPSVAVVDNDGSLQVSGILEGDQAQVSFTCPADRLTGVYVSTEPGGTKVALSWAGEPVLLEGEKASYYTLPATKARWEPIPPCWRRPQESLCFWPFRLSGEGGRLEKSSD